MFKELVTTYVVAVAKNPRKTRRVRTIPKTAKTLETSTHFDELDPEVAALRALFCHLELVN